jgi:hypothetical protein
MYITTSSWSFILEEELPPVSKTISLGLGKSVSSSTCCWNIHNHHIPPSSVYKISAFFPQYIYAMNESQIEE